MIPGWKLYRHLAVLNRKLCDVAVGRIKRLIVSMPPQHGKSSMVSEAFPAWYLGHWPDNRIILCSYEADFAASWGKKARGILVEHGMELFGVTIDPGSSAADRWDILGHQGGMKTAGTSGPVTGKSGNVILIDDPIKLSSEARSAAFRRHQWEWYLDTARTRRADADASIVLVMTRWHEDDLAGRLIAASEDGSGDHFEVIRFPALAEVGDVLGRAEGEPLWPERFPLADYQATRRVSGPVVWSGLYQQRPSPLDGEHFKRSGVRYYHLEDAAGPGEEETFVLHQMNGDELRVPSRHVSRFATGDLAISESDEADFTVFCAWGYTGVGEEPWRGKLLLLDMVRDHLAGPDQLPALRRLLAKTDCTYSVLEATQYQAALVQQARRAGLAVRKAETKGDKVTRAQPAAAMWAEGDVYLSSNASYVPDFIEEHVQFSKGAHDDQVDNTAYAALELGRVRPNEFFGPISISR